MGMSELLGEVFGTTKQAHSEEDLQKAAQVSFFNDLCKKAGIEVDKLNDEQISRLWKHAQENMPAFMTGGAPPAESEKKEAPPEEKKEEEKKDEKKEEEKEAAAKREYEVQHAAVVKVAEAEAMGRIMAHAYVDELKKIAADAGQKQAEGDAPPPPAEEKKEEEKKDEEKKEAQARVEYATVGQGSSTPNLDEFAAHHAIAMLKQAGVDEQIAFRKISAAYELGLEDTTKVAAAQNFEGAVYLRALEFCEKAGFPVDWSKA